MNELTPERYPYELPFQVQVLALCFRDKSVLKRSREAINPEYFENEAHRWICSRLLEYFDEYHELPSRSSFETFFIEFDRSSAKYNVYHGELDNVYTVELENTEFTRDRLLHFGKIQIAKIALLEAADHARGGNLEGILEQISRVSKLDDSEIDEGHYYLRDFDKRADEEHRIELVTVQTGWRRIDSLMKGGLHPGVTIFLAPYGKGKTSFMLNVGAVALQMGQRVVHYTLELSTVMVRERYDMRISGIPAELLVGQFKDLAGKIEMIRARRGELIIKEFSAGAASTRTIRNHVERLIDSEQRPNLIIVDYIKLLRSAERSDVKHEELGMITRELRALSTDLRIPVLTAQQTQRGTQFVEMVEGDNIADSIKILEECDVALTFSQTLAEVESERLRVTFVKNRFGPNHQTTPFIADFKRMMIQESPEAGMRA